MRLAPRAVIQPISRVKPAHLDERPRDRVHITDDLRTVSNNSKVLCARNRDAGRIEWGKLDGVSVKTDGAVRGRRHECTHRRARVRAGGGLYDDSMRPSRSDGSTLTRLIESKRLVGCAGYRYVLQVMIIRWASIDGARLRAHAKTSELGGDVFRDRLAVLSRQIALWIDVDEGRV